MKYGFFVHYVWGGDAYSVTVNKDGSKPAGLDDVANRFDAEGFADDVASMGVEYVCSPPGTPTRTCFIRARSWTNGCRAIRRNAISSAT